MRKNVIDFIIIPDKELVIEYFDGPVSLQDAITLKYREIQVPDYKPEYSFITDLRRAELLINYDQLAEFFQFMEFTGGIIGQRCSAIVTETPKQVAFAELFRDYGNHLPVEWEIFSTLQSALKWLNAPLSEFDYNSITRELYSVKKEV